MNEDAVEMLRAIADELERERPLVQRAIRVLEQFVVHCPPGVNPNLDATIAEARKVMRELDQC